MAHPSFESSVSITGDAVTMTQEACTVVSGKTFKIDDGDKEVWDPVAAITVRDATVLVGNADIESIDLLHGVIVFAASYTVNGAIDVSGKYLPRTTVAKAFQLTIDRARDLLPDEKFGDTSKLKIPGLVDGGGSISIRDVADTTVGGGDSIAVLFNNGTPLVLSFLPGTGLDTLRARMFIEGIALDADVAGQIINNLSWTIAKTESADGYDMSVSEG